MKRHSLAAVAVLCAIAAPLAARTVYVPVVPKSDHAQRELRITLHNHDGRTRTALSALIPMAADGTAASTDRGQLWVPAGQSRTLVVPLLGAAACSSSTSTAIAGQPPSSSTPAPSRRRHCPCSTRGDFAQAERPDHRRRPAAHPRRRAEQSGSGERRRRRHHLLARRQAPRRSRPGRRHGARAAAQPGLPARRARRARPRRRAARQGDRRLRPTGLRLPREDRSRQGHHRLRHADDPRRTWRQRRW